MTEVVTVTVTEIGRAKIQPLATGYSTLIYIAYKHRVRELLNNDVSNLFRPQQPRSWRVSSPELKYRDLS